MAIITVSLFRKVIFLSLSLFLSLSFIVFFSGWSSLQPFLTASCTRTGSDLNIPGPLPFFQPYTRSSLLAIFNNTTRRHAYNGNFELGCNDFAIAASYYRAISDRLEMRNRGRKLIIIDVGANTGQDAASVFGAFHKIEGMCKGFNVPILLVSIEPSPVVFCQLYDFVVAQNWSGIPNAHFLNLALSNALGLLKFSDPGNEGGSLIEAHESNSTANMEMTRAEFEKLQQCHFSQINQTIDLGRTALVPTYTMDALMLFLETIEIANRLDSIYVLKIDTEGFEGKVLEGASHLLDDKRIVFVLFELGTNRKAKHIVLFMRSKGYMCFLFTPALMVPIDGEAWWYDILDQDSGFWGNGVCGIIGSQHLAMFWRMYHADDLSMIAAFELL